MKKFKVISQKGVTVGGAHHKQGATFEAETKSAHVQTALHFKQIEMISDKEADADTKAKEKAAAKAESEAKAKTEADANANK